MKKDGIRDIIESGDMNIGTKNWIKGVYEHIDSKPMYIDSEAQLKHECEKRGLIAKAFAKPKSQGKGLEWKK